MAARPRSHQPGNRRCGRITSDGGAEPTVTGSPTENGDDTDARFRGDKYGSSERLFSGNVNGVLATESGDPPPAGTSHTRDLVLRARRLR